MNVHRKLVGCATVAYIVEPDGSTSGHHVVSNLPNASFNKSAIKAAKKFKYEATASNTSKQAILTTNTFSYRLEPSELSRDGFRETISSQCTEAATQVIEEQYGLTGQ